MSDEEKRLYRGLFLVNFLIALGFGITDPFLPVYAVSSGATAFHLALIFSGYAVAKTLVSPLTGWWSDRRGRRGLILSGLFLYLVISLCYLALPGPLVLLLLRFFQGIAAALVRPVSLALVGDIAPARKEGETMGTFDISFYGALAIGPVIGGFIKDTAGFSGLFAVLSVLCALSFLSALFFVTASPNRGTDGVRIDLSVLKRSRMLVGLSGFIFARSFGITLFAIFVPVFMYENLKLKGIEMGIIMGAATVVTALLLKPMGYLSDRLKRRWLVIVGGSVAALLTVCIPMTRSFLDLFLLSMGIGVFSVLSLPASSALLVREGNTYGMGFTMGIFNGAMNLAAVLAPLTGGTILGLFGINALFYVGGTVGLFGIIFFSLYTRAVGSPKKGNERRFGPVKIHDWKDHKYAVNYEAHREGIVETRIKPGIVSRILLLFVGTFFVFCLGADVCWAAQNANVTCTHCHKDGSKILPPSHKAYNMGNTAFCFGCHSLNGKGKPLGERIHSVHARKAGNTMSDCFSCHIATKQGEIVFLTSNIKASRERMDKLKPFFLSWMKSPYLDYSHQEKDVSCTACHGTAYIDGRMPADTQPQCVKCHGDYPEMIKKTAKSASGKNPHKSHLPEVSCSTCHHGHEPFEDMCASCHSFGFKAPGH